MTVLPFGFSYSISDCLKTKGNELEINSFELLSLLYESTGYQFDHIYLVVDVDISSPAIAGVISNNNVDNFEDENDKRYFFYDIVLSKSDEHFLYNGSF